MKNCKGFSNETKIAKYIGQILSSWTHSGFCEFYFTVRNETLLDIQALQFDLRLPFHLTFAETLV